MLIKHDIPILEYDNAYDSVINPWRKPGILPRQCLLYSGDSLADPKNYDDRKWSEYTSSREKLAYLALEALIRL